jgi:hypothetical protein
MHLAGDGFDSFEEEHSLGLFTTETYLTAMDNAGITETWVLSPPGDFELMRPLILGRITLHRNLMKALI